MNKTDIIEYYAGNMSSLTPLNIVLILTAALLGSLVIYVVYKATCVDRPYNASFNNGNILLALITAVIMMMISSNIVISLGMVGALSIIRFRTAVKDSRDTIFLFWSIVLGLCTGSQNFSLALISTVFIAIVCVVISFMPKAAIRKTLIIRANGANASHVEAVVLEADSKARQDAVNYYENSQEWVYTLSVKGAGASALAEKLYTVPGVMGVNVVSGTVE